MKFGGSSVVDAAAIDRVASIVESERGKGHTPVVVVSALGGVTDMLLSLARAAQGGSAAEVRAGVAALLARHRTQAAALGADADATLTGALETLVKDLQVVLDTIQREGARQGAGLDAVAAT
jgi:aspartokinase